MRKLVVDQSYELGVAWDRTAYRNHGILHYATPGTGTFRSCLSFARGRTAPGSCVAIPPSKSLRDFGSVRIRAKICTTSGGGHRQNIVEGQLAFAFFVNPDRSIQGTFYDPSQQWTGIRSAAGLIQPNRWHTVEFWYDGISAAELLVDGVRVATSFDPNAVQIGPMHGPVRGVGPYGIFIGHWPAQDDRYTFDGYIRCVRIYKRDDEDLFGYVDPCCQGDRKTWLEMAARMKDAGFTETKLRSLLDGLATAGGDFLKDLRGGSEAEAREADQLMAQFLYALRHRKSVPLEPSMEPLMAWVADRIRPDQAESLRENAQKFLDALPFSQDDVLKMAERLCFGDLRRTVEAMNTRFGDDRTWKARRDAYKRR